jgi:hypothetical protein
MKIEKSPFHFKQFTQEINELYYKIQNYFTLSGICNQAVKWNHEIGNCG